MSVAEALEAEFSQFRNDLYWKVFDLKDGFVRWGGYDDAYWWNSVSKHDSTRKRTGKVTGRIYEIDFDTGKVFVTEPQALERVDGEGGVKS